MERRESPFTLVASVPLWLVAAFLSLALANDLSEPRQVCESTVPPFEGLVVDEAAVHWIPPLIRCELVDTDLATNAERVTTGAWGWPGAALVVVLDLASLTDITRRVLRFRQRSTP